LRDEEADAMSLNQDLSNIVGREWVSTEADLLTAYSTDHSFVPPGMPQCVVKPGSLEEVQETVQWANRMKSPLVPVSSGGPRVRGDTIPGKGGVVVDLGRMQQVIRVDRKNRVVVIEPGVTFAQLSSELNEQGLRLAGPLLPRANKSVVASVLEREPTLMPRYHWDISDPLCCMEVVFGSGDVFRTGEAAGPGGLEGQWAIGGAQKFPLGPHQVDYHRLVQGAQGTMGVVTWATIKCELVPELRKPFFVAAQRLEDLFGFAYELTKQGYGDELFLANRVQLAGMLKETGLHDDFAQTLESLPRWVLVFCLSGGRWFADEQLEYLERDLKRIAQGHGQTLLNAVGKATASHVLALLGKPSGEPYWKYNVRGGFREIFFVSTLDRFPALLEVVHRVAQESGFARDQIGVYVQPIVQGTSCHCEFDIYFDPREEKEASKARGLFEQASGRLIEQGAFFSRPYPAWADQVYASRGQFVSSLKKVKSVFDPNHVMNPGKLCF
jgi:FAD/FMN-containing dehydrogenase